MDEGACEYQSVKDKLREQIVSKIDMTMECDDQSLAGIIDNVLFEYEEYISYKDMLKLKKELFNSMRKYDVLSELLEDESITDIMVNGLSEIYVDKEGRMQPAGCSFESIDKLENVIQHIVSLHNRVVNETSPIVDVRMEDGSRVNVVMPPVAINGPILTIRKFPKQDFTLKKYIEMNTLSKEAGIFLEQIVKSRYNIFISGGTGSGKTTFLNVLSGCIPSYERIITIEDSAELRIQGIDNIVSLETRNANLEGKNEVTMSDLIKSSLRMIPSRIVVGEVRGTEAFDMIQAMNTGHDGSLSTGHANSAMDMLGRLETLVLMSKDFPLQAVRRQIASAIDIVIHLGRIRDRSRRVMEISEVLLKDGEYMLNKLFEFIPDDYGAGKLVRTDNKLINDIKLKKAGICDADFIN